MKILIAAIMAFSFSAFAHEHEGHKDDHHREHKAHTHGHATLSIAFQGHDGKVEFTSPAESVIGFEHEAVKEKDIKAKDAAIAKFETEIGNIVAFAPDLKCVFTKDKIEQVLEEGCTCGNHGKGHGKHHDKKEAGEHKEAGHKCEHKDGKSCEHKEGKCACGKSKGKKGTHSDFVASFNVKCERSPDDTTLTVEIQKHFPKVKETEVTVLVGAIQKSVKLKKKAESIELK